MTATPAESREELEKLERKHADNPEGRYFVPLANAYRKVGEIDRAMTLLREGLERHPDYLSAHIVLGRCLADRGESAAADTEFRYVLSLDPQNLIALRTLGELAMSAGKVEEARSWYGDLLSVDPMNEDARRALDSIARVPAPLDFPADMDVPAERSIAAGEMAPSAPQRVAADGDFVEYFGAMVDLDSSAEGEVGFAEDADAVVTETIAELYTRQGFYDRAADVYRELIRRRGGDAALADRLRRVEELASAEGDADPSTGAGGAHTQLEESSSAAGPQEDALASHLDAAAGDSRISDDSGWISLPADEGVHVEGFERVGDISSHLVSGLRGDRPEGRPAQDPFADSFSEGFSFEGGEAPPPSSRGPVASVSDTWGGAAPSEETGGGPSIRDFIRSVVAWSPSTPSASEAVDNDRGHDPSNEVDSGLLADTSFLEDPSYLSDPGSPYPMIGNDAAGADRPDSPFGADTDGASETTDDDDREPESRDTGFEWLPTPSPADPEDLFPWEIPDDDADRLAIDVPTLESLQLDSGYPFDHVSLESGIGDSDIRPIDVDLPFADPVNDTPVAEERVTLAAEPEPVAGSAVEREPEPEARPAAPDPHDDDDLESFQAWLRSLKH